MILKDARISYEYASGKLSDIVRQLSFAGVAVIWIFRKEGDGLNLEEGLLLPLFTFVTALGFDLLHYIYTSFVWGFYAHKKEKEGHSDSDVIAPPDYINWPTLFCFWTKAFLCVVAFVMLLVFLKHKI